MPTQFEDKFVEDICNVVFPGTTFAYRDTNLSEELISKYKKGMIIMERGFVDSSSKGGGMISNLRYLVISSQNKDMPSLFQDFGLCTISMASYFKVLDIFSVNNKTQITLLHIPKESVELFDSCTISLEETITEKARENFLSKLELEPVPELKNDEWIERVKDPLGMDDDGNFFELVNA